MIWGRSQRMPHTMECISGSCCRIDMRRRKKLVLFQRFCSDDLFLLTVVKYLGKTTVYLVLVIKSLDRFILVLLFYAVVSINWSLIKPLSRILSQKAQIRIPAHIRVSKDIPIKYSSLFEQYVNSSDVGLSRQFKADNIKTWTLI